MSLGLTFKGSHHWNEDITALGNRNVSYNFLFGNECEFKYINSTRLITRFLKPKIGNRKINHIFK